MQRAAPLRGIYDVEAFARDGEPVPALAGDATRWKRLIVGWPGSAVVHFMDGTGRGYRFRPDLEAGTVSIAPFGPRGGGGSTEPPPPASELELERLAGGVLVLRGALDGAEVEIRMRRRDPDDFLLINRGFRWRSERPYNR